MDLDHPIRLDAAWRALSRMDGDDSYKRRIDAHDLYVFCLWMAMMRCFGFSSSAQVDGLVDFYEQHVPVKARVSKQEQHGNILTPSGCDDLNPSRSHLEDISIPM